MKLSDRINTMEWGFPSPGGIDKVDMDVLEDLVKQQLTKAGAEIRIADVGCWTGKSTVTFALADTRVKVEAIDWFRGSDGTALATAANDTTVKDVLYANLRYFDVFNKVNVSEDKSVEAAQKFSDKSFDIVFIDADHRYLNVLEDLKAWYPKVKPGGFFCGHDCEFILRKNAPSWNFFADTTDNPWNGDDFIQMHPGVVRAVSKMFPNATILGKQIWMITK